MKHKWIIGAAIIIIICAVLVLSSGNVLDQSNEANTSDVTLKVIAEGPWSAEITDGDGIDNLFNESNATYSLNGNSSISVTVIKGSNDNANLEAQLIRDGKVVSQQSTSAPLGTVTVKI